MTHTFQLTQVHIDLGKRGAGDTCPVALCLNANGYPEAHVYRVGTNPNGYGEPGPFWQHGDNLYHWIADYDNREPVSPVTLVLTDKTLEIQ